MKKRNLILILIFTFFYFANYAQTSVSFYQNDTNSKIGIGYEFHERLWADLRVYSGTNIENFTPELVLNYNLVKKERYETYIGAGLSLNNISGIIIPVGVAIKPLDKIKNLTLNIELNPTYEMDLDDLLIRGFIGVRYVLK
ncbi:hypothetical protein [Polaribacter sp. R77954]|uniref:hypothetical protein n=1 Tax=Polaribacter sp. R77954 TaxID=3093870 RepID=UPI0037CAF6A6